MTRPRIEPGLLDHWQTLYPFCINVGSRSCNFWLYIFAFVIQSVQFTLDKFRVTSKATVSNLPWNICRIKTENNFEKILKFQNLRQIRWLIVTLFLCNFEPTWNSVNKHKNEYYFSKNKIVTTYSTNSMRWINNYFNTFLLISFEYLNSFFSKNAFNFDTAYLSCNINLFLILQEMSGLRLASFCLQTYITH